jgi:hypothetical protein
MIGRTLLSVVREQGILTVFSHAAHRHDMKVA